MTFFFQSIFQIPLKNIIIFRNIIQSLRPYVTRHVLGLIKLETQGYNIYLSTPDVFRNIVDQQVSPALTGSQPECGMMMWFTTTCSPSSMMDFFRSSQDERFHNTPVTSSLTSASAVLRSRLMRRGIPPAFLMARLFSSF